MEETADSFHRFLYLTLLHKTGLLITAFRYWSPIIVALLEINKFDRVSW